ncbi:hypothetical protein 2017DhaAA_0520 [Vibrio phage ICP1]|nr:hypothetical protein 2017DhaAA_0520 [Vibrio phage ICP1]
MKFTKEQLLGKKIRYNGEEQWQQIVDACAAVGIPVGEWGGCKHKGGNCVAKISRNFKNSCNEKLLSTPESRWDYEEEDVMEEFRDLEELVFPFEDDVNKDSSEWDTYPPVGTECEYSSMDSNVWWKCIFVGTVGDFVYVDVAHLDDVQKFKPQHIHLRPIKPKSWQEVLCEEYKEKNGIFRYFEYQEATDLFKLECHIESEEIVALAKRIIELSEKSSQK